MQLVADLFKQHARSTALALALAAMAQMLTLCDPLIFQYVVDTYAHSHRPSGAVLTHIAVFAAAAVLIGAAARLARCFQEYLVTQISHRAGLWIYGTGMRHVLSLPALSLEDRMSGELLETLQRARRDVERFIPAAINLAFTTLIALAFVMAYASRLHWSIIPVYAVSVPVLILFSVGISRRIRQIQVSICGGATSLAGVAAESIRNLHIIQVLGLVRQEIERLNAAAESITELERQRVRKLCGYLVLQSGCVNAVRIGVLVLMIWLYLQGAVSVGELASLFVYSYFIFGPLQESGYVLGVFREVEASHARWRALLSIPCDRSEDCGLPLTSLASLAFDDVSFRYPGACTMALANITFSASRGETIALVGPSGSGKTTLVNLIVGVFRPSAGVITWNGVPSEEVALHSVRERTGCVAQNTQLFSGTIRDNLRFVNAAATDANCIAAIREASLAALLERSERGLDTPIGEGGLKLSGGEKQRLAIARAVVRSPELFIFDEATSSLDAVTEHEVTKAIRNVVARRRAIVILVSHRLASVAYADRIYVLDKSRIVEWGNHKELLDRGGLYAAMWRRQHSLSRDSQHAA